VLDAMFHNPYTFIWTPPRDPSAPFAGDSDPAAEADHGRLHPDRYSGMIRLRVTTVTPLLLVDTDPARVTTLEDRNGHKVFDSREDIPATAMKGMLRSAYETITNSRYGVFAGHDRPLGRRTAATIAPSLVPGRIEQRGDRLQARLLRGKSDVAPTGAFRILRNGSRKQVPEGQAVNPVGPRTLECKSGWGYAALLPRYDRESAAADRGESGQYTDGSGLPEHGDACWIEVEPDRSRFGWKVKRIWRRREGDRQPPRQAQAAYLGWVYRTGPTIKDKHQERVFFEAANRTPAILPLESRVVEAYEDLIADYQDTHRKDAEDRRRAKKRMSDYLGPDPGATAFGAYVYEESRKTLQPGDLVFVRLRNGQAVALYPCMISRDLQPASPTELLHESLHPATQRGDLSPADRLFGWVRQSGEQSMSDGDAAWRGRLRITTTPDDQHLQFQQLTSEEQPFGLPLAILGEPKPAQARFYVGKPGGHPLDQGCTKDEATYQKSRVLRGRKAYWHHSALPDGYWDLPLQDRTSVASTNPGYHQEYRRPPHPEKGERDSQNRSIRRWIAPGSTATLTLHLTNASLEDIGALLYLASLPEDCHLRMGGGKPLGFGSVRLELAGGEETALHLANGEAWKTYYESLSEADPAWRRDLTTMAKDRFFEAMADAFGKPSEGSASKRFQSLDFVRHFVAASRGPRDGLAIHYPRVTPSSEPEGKNFEWFVENERVEGSRPAGHSLPQPTDDPGLPYWPWGVDPRQRQQGQGGGRGRPPSQAQSGGSGRESSRGNRPSSSPRGRR